MARVFVRMGWKRKNWVQLKARRDGFCGEVTLNDISVGNEF